MYELSNQFEYRLFIIKNMVHELLFFIPRSIPEFTDHGVRHSERIEQIIRNLLIPICNKSVDTELNTDFRQPFIFHKETTILASKHIG